MKLKRYLLLAVIMFWAGVGHAQTMMYETETGKPVFQITYPSGWTLDLDFDKPRKEFGGPPPPRVVEAMPSDGSLLWLGIWIPPEVRNFEQAQAYLDSLEQHILTDVQASEPRSEQLNGMPAYVIEGTAKKDNEDVNWSMAFFQPTKDVVAAAFYVAVPAAEQKHKKDLDALVASLRPVK